MSMSRQGKKPKSYGKCKYCMGRCQIAFLVANGSCDKEDCRKKAWRAMVRKVGA